MTFSYIALTNLANAENLHLQPCKIKCKAMSSIKVLTQTKNKQQNNEEVTSYLKFMQQAIDDNTQNKNDKFTIYFHQLAYI
jgi:hypothetical protein